MITTRPDKRSSIGCKRLAALPAGVVPLISPASPIGEIYRYTLKTPKNKLGQEIYTLNDIKASARLAARA